jgi:hypothetical protein
VVDLRKCEDAGRPAAVGARGHYHGRIDFRITGKPTSRRMNPSRLELAGVLQRADSGGQLTPEEYVRYRRYLIATYRYYENAYYQYRHGLYDEAEYTTQKVAWRNYVSRLAASIAIWCDMRSSFSPEFAREMDSLIPRKC